MIDPDTGQLVDSETGEVVSNGQQVNGVLVAAAVPVTTSADGGVGTPAALVALAVLFLLAAVVLPPLLARRWRPEDPA